MGISACISFIKLQCCIHKSLGCHQLINYITNFLQMMVQQQQSPSPSLPLQQHIMFNGMLAGPPGGGLMAMPPPPPVATGNLLSLHPTAPTKLSPHNMVQFNPGIVE